MRILILIHRIGVFSSKKWPLFCRTRGIEVSVVTPKIYRDSRYFEDQNGIKVYRFPFLAGNKLLIEYEKIPYLRMVLYYLTGFFLTLYVLLRNRAPDSCPLGHPDGIDRGVVEVPSKAHCSYDPWF